MGAFEQSLHRPVYLHRLTVIKLILGLEGRQYIYDYIQDVGPRARDVRTPAIAQLEERVTVIG